MSSVEHIKQVVLNAITNKNTNSALTTMILLHNQAIASFAENLKHFELELE